MSFLPHLVFSILATVKLWFILSGNGAFHYPIYWMYVFVGVVGLIFRSKLMNHPPFVFTTSILAAGICFFSLSTIDDAITETKYYFLPMLLVLFGFLVLHKNLSWLKPPSLRQFALVPIIVIATIVIGSAPRAAVLMYYSNVNPAISLSSLGILGPTNSREGIWFHVNVALVEESARLGVHLSGVMNPVLNAAVFAAYHAYTDPELQRTRLLNLSYTATGRVAGAYTYVASQERILRFVTLLIFWDIFSSGFILLAVTLRTGTIWLAVVAHLLINILSPG